MCTNYKVMVIAARIWVVTKSCVICRAVSMHAGIRSLATWWSGRLAIWGRNAYNGKTLQLSSYLWIDFTISHNTYANSLWVVICNKSILAHLWIFSTYVKDVFLGMWLSNCAKVLLRICNLTLWYEKDWFLIMSN